MKNKIALLFIALAMLVIAKNPVQALNIEIDNHGVTRFWQDQVLGQEDSHNTNKEAATRVRIATPIRTMRPTEKQVIQIEPGEAGASTVRIRDQYPQEEIQTWVEQQKKEVDNATEKAVETREKAKELKKKVFEKKEEIGTERVELKAKVKSQIQNKKEEKEVQIRTKLKEIIGENAATELEIKSGNVRATTRAMVTIDPETKQLQLVTPSGEVHMLKHLPDEAINAMRRSGKLMGEIAQDEEAQIAVGEDGSIQYKTIVDQEKRFLGIFKRNVQSQVVLNDATGEVMQATLEGLSPLASLLNRLSI